GMFGVTSISTSVRVALARFPLADLLLGLVLADAVGVLDLADELVTLAADDVEVAVGQLAPLLLHGALRLLPVSCDAIPIHLASFQVRDRCTRKASRGLPPNASGVRG